MEENGAQGLDILEVGDVWHVCVVMEIRKEKFDETDRENYWSDVLE